jgi:hypothetical protein
MDYAVKDATKDLILTVDDSDIKTAKRRESGTCAAAYALCRQGSFNEARVYRKVTYARKLDGTWLRFITPDDLYVELMVFDRGGRMQAGEFRLRAPTGVKRLGHHPKPKGKGGKTGKLPTTPHIIESVRDIAPKGRSSLKALFEDA